MTTIGVLGGTWRATVLPGGTVAQWDGLPALSWYVAADDRWHVPQDEVSVRQQALQGTPVVETRVRIPTGDAVHRTFAVAAGAVAGAVAGKGMTIVQIENDSTLPIAVAFAGPALLSPRPPADTPVAGIELPAGAVMFPVGHHATLTVAIAHSGGPAGQLPSGWPQAAQVVRGWMSIVDRAGRFDLPDGGAVADVVHARCELLLGGPDLPAEDPVGFLIGADQIVRMTGDAEKWVPEIADAVHRVLRLDTVVAWDGHAALDAAVRLLTAAGERRAVRDLERNRRKPADVALPASADGVRALALAEQRIARNGELFPMGLPDEWWGSPIEVHGVPVGPASTVSFAIRWHGARPALLWEVAGEPVELTAPRAAPGWSTRQPSGDALWPAPDAGAAAMAASTGASASPEPSGSSASSSSVSPESSGSSASSSSVSPESSGSSSDGVSFS